MEENKILTEEGNEVTITTKGGKIWKSIVIGLSSAIAILGAIFGIFKLIKKDGKDNYPSFEEDYYEDEKNFECEETDSEL